jgi:hypothetical protein
MVAFTFSAAIAPQTKAIAIDAVMINLFIFNILGLFDLGTKLQIISDIAMIHLLFFVSGDTPYYIIAKKICGDS